MSTAPLIKPTLPSLPSRLFFLHIRPSPIRIPDRRSPLALSHSFSPHSPLHYVCTGFGAATQLRRFVRCISTTRYTLPPVPYRSPGCAHAPLHPPPHSALFTVSFLAAMPVSHGLPLHTFHNTRAPHPCPPATALPPPFARTHVARRSHPSTRFSNLPPHSSSPLIAGLYILFSVAMAKPCCYLQRYVACCGCIHFPPTLPPSGRPAEICN